LYSTRGGTSANVCLSNIPCDTSSDNLVESALLLVPLSDSLNCLYLTGSVVQHNGNRISSAALFVINFLMIKVSFNSFEAPHPVSSHSFLTIGNFFSLVSIDAPTVVPPCLTALIVYLVNHGMRSSIERDAKKRCCKTAVSRSADCSCMHANLKGVCGDGSELPAGNRLSQL